MKKIDFLSDNLKIELLDFLYEDEVLNIFMIHYLENQPEAVGELYIGRTGNEVSEVLHIKNDGNSYFTSFYCPTPEGLQKAAHLLGGMEDDPILLAGRAEQVEQILSCLNKKEELYMNNYYRFSGTLEPLEVRNDEYAFRKAVMNVTDTERLKELYVEFFEAEDEKDIERLTDEDKITEDLKNGVYFLEVKGEVAGMARFFGYSKNYMDITTVLVDSRYRNKGYGELIMRLMVQEALRENKTPITQTSLVNEKARHIYEKIGFEKVCDYTFQFL